MAHVGLTPQTLALLVRCPRTNLPGWPATDVAMISELPWSLHAFLSPNTPGYALFLSTKEEFHISPLTQFLNLDPRFRTHSGVNMTPFRKTAPTGSLRLPRPSKEASVPQCRCWQAALSSSAPDLILSLVSFSLCDPSKVN